MPGDSSIQQDKELFDNSFGEWLEAHGVVLHRTPVDSKGFGATIDLNELKVAILLRDKELERRARLDQTRLCKLASIDSKSKAEFDQWCFDEQERVYPFWERVGEEPETDSNGGNDSASVGL